MVDKADLLAHAEQTAIAGTQRHYLINDKINALFGAVEDLARDGIVVSVRLGSDTDAEEPEQFPRMLYKDGSLPMQVHSEEEMSDLEGEGWSTSMTGNEIVQRDAQFPHLQPSSIPTDPGLVHTPGKPVGVGTQESDVLDGPPAEEASPAGGGALGASPAGEGPVEEPSPGTAVGDPNPAPHLGPITPAATEGQMPKSDQPEEISTEPTIVSAVDASAGSPEAGDVPAPGPVLTDEQPSGAPNVEHSTGPHGSSGEEV